MTHSGTAPTAINTAAELPYKLLRVESDLQCEWLKLDGQRFTEPFFDDTIARLIYQPKNRQRRVTPVDEMIRAAAGIAGVIPAAVIFHISRCGSTLVSQAFAMSNRFIALAEAPFFDEILRFHYRYPELTEKYDADALFNAALRHYGLARYAEEKQVLIKTDCWHIFFYERLRRLLPNTPFVLMYRHPAEVFRSLVKKAGIQVLPNMVEPEIFGLAEMAEMYNLRNYTSAVIEKMLKKVIEIARVDKNALLINYDKQPATMVEEIASFAGIELNEAEWEMIQGRLKYSSKEPAELFLKEPPAEIPESILPALACYDVLEKMRARNEYL